MKSKKKKKKKERKKRKKKKKKRSSPLFMTFPTSISNFPPSFYNFPSFLLNFHPFSLPSFFPMRQQKFPGQKTVGAICPPAPPPPPPPVTPLLFACRRRPKVSNNVLNLSLHHKQFFSLHILWINSHITFLAKKLAIFSHL